MTRSAVERGIEIISEASRHLPKKMKARHPRVRWANIAGIGNVLRHDINGWRAISSARAVKDNVPDLKVALVAMKAELES